MNKKLAIHKLVKISWSGNMESVHSHEFNFETKTFIWQNVYNQKICEMFIPKICEFFYKILHHVLPCGANLNKKNISSKCQFCDDN